MTEQMVTVVTELIRAGGTTAVWVVVAIQSVSLIKAGMVLFGFIYVSKAITSMFGGNDEPKK